MIAEPVVSAIFRHQLTDALTAIHEELEAWVFHAEDMIDIRVSGHQPLQLCAPNGFLDLVAAGWAVQVPGDDGRRSARCFAANEGSKLLHLGLSIRLILVGSAIVSGDSMCVVEVDLPLRSGKPDPREGHALPRIPVTVPGFVPFAILRVAPERGLFNRVCADGQQPAPEHPALEVGVVLQPRSMQPLQ